MTGPIRVTRPLLAVLEVFIEALADDHELHGWAILKQTKLGGPTVYGMLDRLEDADWITSRWEDQPQGENRPRRRFYRLTPTGAVGARELLKARRPSALGRPTQRPQPGPAFVGWLRGLAGGAQ